MQEQYKQGEAEEIMRITRTALVVSGMAVAGLGLAACGPAVAKTTSAPKPSSAAPSSAIPSTYPPIPTASATPVTTGPLGTSFTVTTTDDSGNPVVYTVTLVQVDQNAALSPYETENNPSDHTAAAKFSITGITGSESDDANSDASATGTDTTLYPFTATQVTDGPNFSSGMFQVGPGQTESGWVTFELPAGVKVASVAWAPGFDSQAATWTLGS